MSGSARNTRNQLSLDYRVYHKTGERVEKIRVSKRVSAEGVQNFSDPDMATDNLREMSININSDVEDFFDSYSIELIMDDEIELERYVSKIEELKKEHRRAHAHIREKDVENFNTLYPNYETVKVKLNEMFSVANKK